MLYEEIINTRCGCGEKIVTFGIRKEDPELKPLPKLPPCRACGQKRVVIDTVVLEIPE